MENGPAMRAFHEETLSGWGRYSSSRATVVTPQRNDIDSIFSTLRGAPRGMIGRGTGLAYGDAALNRGGHVLSTQRLDRILSFDPASGRLACESGVTLGQIVDLCLAEGWTLPVTPGTARVTVGGCLAFDVHGKNHPSAGTFSQHLLNATLLTGNGELITCGPDQQPDLFWATAGGMGLTGFILEMTLQLRRVETAYILARRIITRDLDDTFRALEASAGATYLTGLLDGVSRGPQRGRGTIVLGEPATLADLPPERRAAPLATPRLPSKSLVTGFPSALLVRPLALGLNARAYRRARAAGPGPELVEARRYFYALDRFDNWNRLYGSRGFFEYQVLLPAPRAFDTIRRMMTMLDEAGGLSFYTTIKRLGASAPGPLSFPAPGYAFNFDMPTGGKEILALLDRYDEITHEAGGRLYLAKDARLRPEMFTAMYPRHQEWLDLVAHHDKAEVFASDISRRLRLRGR